MCRFTDGGNADVLLMWEFSRATRDMTAFTSLLDLCAARGVAWSYSGRLYDLSRTDDRFATGLDALVAAREASQIRTESCEASGSRPRKVGPPASDPTAMTAYTPPPECPCR